MSCDNVMIGGVEFVPKCSLPSGKRAVVVVDRGWIFAGDIEEKDGRIILTRVVHVRSWSGVGFDGMIADPTKSVKIRRLAAPVDLPRDAEIFRVPVADDWGL